MATVISGVTVPVRPDANTPDSAAEADTFTVPILPEANMPVMPC